MKKYRVTDKHPEIKEGIIFKRQNHDGMYLSPSSFIHIPDEDIPILLAKGWIEEIQELEFTKRDVIDILIKYNCDFVKDPQKCDFVELIKEWEYYKNKT